MQTMQQSLTYSRPGDGRVAVYEAMIAYELQQLEAHVNYFQVHGYNGKNNGFAPRTILKVASDFALTGFEDRRRNGRFHRAAESIQAILDDINLELFFDASCCGKRHDSFFSAAERCLDIEIEHQAKRQSEDYPGLSKHILSTPKYWRYKPNWAADTPN